MRYMRGVVVPKAGSVEIRNDIPIPELRDYECLVRTHACGFCNGTDLQVIAGTIEESGGFMGFPTVLGHEGSCEVIELGPRVRHIQLGDRYIHNNLRPNVGNGYTKTYGSMAEYGLIVDHQAMLEDGYLPSAIPFWKKQEKFPKEIDFIDGAMLLSLAESHSAAINFGTKKGDHVLIYGAGPMGTALALFMKLLGAEKITLIDSVEERLRNAKRVADVDRTINFSKCSVRDILKNELFDLVIDAVGRSNILIEGSHFVKPGGSICSLGVLRKDDLCINVGKIQSNTRLHMLNWPYGEYDILPKTIELILDGKVNPKDFYSHVLPFTKVNEAMNLVKSRQALKCILIFDEM